MANEVLKAVLNELHAAGVRDVTVAAGGKHLQVRFRANGHERIFKAACTASDVRAVSKRLIGHPSLAAIARSPRCGREKRAGAATESPRIVGAAARTSRGSDRVADRMLGRLADQF